MIYNVRYLRLFAYSGHALDVVRPPGRETARGADDCKHVVRAHLRDCRGESVEVCHDIISFQSVAHDVGSAARGEYALQARLLVDAQPHDCLAARAVGG